METLAVLYTVTSAIELVFRCDATNFSVGCAFYYRVALQGIWGAFGPRLQGHAFDGANEGVKHHFVGP